MTSFDEMRLRVALREVAQHHQLCAEQLDMIAATVVDDTPELLDWQQRASLWHRFQVELLFTLLDETEFRPETRQQSDAIIQKFKEIYDYTPPANRIAGQSEGNEPDKT